MALLKFLGIEKVEPKQEERKPVKVSVKVPSKVHQVTPANNQQSLSPLQVLVLSYAPTFAINQKTFQAFWDHKYGIKNVPSILKNLYKEGYISEGDTVTAIETATVAELKDALQQYGLPVSGKKESLINRVLEGIPSEDLAKLFPNRKYALTAKGQKLLDQYAYIPYIQHHPVGEMDIWEMHDYVQALLAKGFPNTEATYRDAIWGFLNKSSMEQYKYFNFGLYRNSRLQMYLFLTEEKRWKSAVLHLAEVVYLDINGAFNYNYSGNKEYLQMAYYSNADMVFSDRHYHLIPALRGWIEQTIAELGCSYQEFGDMLYESLSKVGTLPLEYFSKQQCVEIAMNYYLGNMEKANDIYHIAAKQFYKKHPKAKR